MDEARRLDSHLVLICFFRFLRHVVHEVVRLLVDGKELFFHPLVELLVGELVLQKSLDRFGILDLLLVVIQLLLGELYPNVCGGDLLV